MTQAIRLIVAFMREVIGLFDSLTFDFFGAEVSYLALVIVLVLVSMTLTVFWKGAKG